MNYVLIVALMFNSVLIADHSLKKDENNMRIILKLFALYAVVAGLILVAKLHSPDMAEFIQSMLIWLNGALFITGSDLSIDEDVKEND